MSGPGIPGPGIVLILIGLSFLALEFERAERVLGKAIIWADQAKDRAQAASPRVMIRTPPCAGLAYVRLPGDVMDRPWAFVLPHRSEPDAGGPASRVRDRRRPRPGGVPAAGGTGGLCPWWRR